MDKIYIIGHKTPDLDSVVAGIAYANLKNKLENTDKYVPARTGDTNPLTDFILEKYGFDKPEILNDEAVQVILVDHNEVEQRFSAADSVKIIEILDHHKLNFTYPDPIEILIKPWGSSTSIVYDLYRKNNIEVDAKMAGLMLSAVLDDTVITKSPTCTEVDKEIITELAKIAGVGDWQAYGIEMFKTKSNVKNLNAEEIIKLDFKDFKFKAGIVGAGQVETVDLSELEPRAEELLTQMLEMQKVNNYYSVILMITDIIKEGSLVLVITNDQEKIEQALNTKLTDNKAYIEGLLSRKKQLIPGLTEVLDK